MLKVIPADQLVAGYMVAMTDAAGPLRRLRSPIASTAANTPDVSGRRPEPKPNCSVCARPL